MSDPLEEKIDFADVQEGLSRKEFFLEYLPTLSLETRACVGGEALIRWRRPTGIVYPDKFIPLVENSILSGPITYWVLEQIALELGAWLRVHEGVHVSINVPPEILGRGAIEYVARHVGLADFASKIVLEISERGIPDKLGIDAINAMSDHPVRVALDNVGLAEANMVIYSRVHVDIIKLDRAFVGGMLEPGWSPAQLNALSALKKAAPQLKIIGEGVETIRQEDLLREAGVDLVQGWLYSKPLLAADFKAFFRARRKPI